jgi:hypothetical protein
MLEERSTCSENNRMAFSSIAQRQVWRMTRHLLEETLANQFAALFQSFQHHTVVCLVNDKRQVKKRDAPLSTVEAETNWEGAGPLCSLPIRL